LIFVASLHTAMVHLRSLDTSAPEAGSSPRKPGSLLAVKQNALSLRSTPLWRIPDL